MPFPDYFSLIPPITLRDPLADLLGAADAGLIEYRFADAVKLTGHACPTVAGAWLMTVHALRALYGKTIPERGGIKVTLSERADAGVAGVIASVATLLTGAAGEGGFKGLGGRHNRQHLLQFAAQGFDGLQFTRRDTGVTVNPIFCPNRVIPDPRMGFLLPRAISGQASEDELRAFQACWQDRVRRMLVEHHDDPQLIRVERCSALAA